MTYVDTTLTAEAGYTYVNARQFYDVVAGGMTTHPAWDFVEYVEAVSAPNTYRRYVWKCNAAQSGLSADFYVVFQVPYTTATGSTLGWLTAAAVRVWMGETYAAGVLGKFATNATSVTLASDLTNPATFTLSTYAVPASLWDVTNTFGTTGTGTSFRYWCLVAKDALLISRAGDATGANPTIGYLLFVGAYEPVLSGAVDPLPIVLLGTSTGSTPFPGGGATRAPTMTPATAYTDVFLVANCTTPSSAYYIGGPNPAVAWANSALAFGTSGQEGTVGLASDTSWCKSVGGPMVSKLVVWPGCTAANRSTKGIFRGYPKYVYGASYATHSYGDTFVVNGRVHVGTGNGNLGAIVDTEAA